MVASPDVVRRISLPVDVVQEKILTRLPVKHLLRCKLLSREYNSLIKSPSFIKKHLLRQQSSPSNNKMAVVGMVDGKTPGGILSVLSSSSSDVVYVPDPARSHILRLVGSCNGLLCASFQPYSKLRLMLWNPATRDQFILPDFQQAFEAMGFGNDAASGDYKFVIFGRNPTFLGVKIWTMSTNCWRDIGDVPKFLEGFGMRECHGMLLPHTNKLYWIATDYGFSNAGDSFILSFDMTDDTFQQITLPSVITSQPGYPDLIDNMGSLVLSTAFESDLGKKSFDIWAIDDNNHCYWTKRFSVESQSHLNYRFRFSISDALVLENFSCISISFILYDPHSKEEKERYSCRDYNVLNKPWSYIESLEKPLFIGHSDFVS